MLLSDDEYEKVMKKEPKGFKAMMGAPALRELLRNVDLDELSVDLRSLIKVETAPQKRKSILKRLQVIEAFRSSGVKPEWMIINILPVIPPDLRPLVPLEGGRYATSDLNDLYRRVITRNNRLKNLLNIKAPEIILRNEKRMLQEAVDALFDNGRRIRPVLGRGGRPLKSLSDSLKGKQGRFRQNLLGKRVDYSGRSVIAVGPELKLYQCGIPKVMALELFKPFIIRKLEQKGYAQSVKGARRLLEGGAKEVWKILDEIVKDHPVLLNRAPTLHRLSIQAFMPVLVEGKAIKLHPLACTPFNADFDGDQMAIHVPLSPESQLESLLLMHAPNNILSPAHGGPISTPTQDIVIGVYYLTKDKKGEKGEGKIFSSPDEVSLAVEKGVCQLHTRILYRLNGNIITTTCGRVLFSQILPEKILFVNETIGKKELIALIERVKNECGNYEAVLFLDRVKDLGFEYATRSGVTIGIDDMIVPKEKKTITERAFRDVKEVEEDRKRGIITEGERYNRVIDIRTNAVTNIEKKSLDTLARDRDGFNPLYMIMTSGARGNVDQVRQITGLRGLMTRPRRHAQGGEIIETPINSNLKEGLSVVEYFISTHGARKGLTDTALKTAQAGYLTRKLVDVAQDVIITEKDCGTIMGRKVSAIKEGEDVIQPLHERIRGRFALEDVINPITSSVIVFAGEEITDEKALEIEECGVQTVTIRSVLTCEAKRGLCQKCYGRNLATGRVVELGEAVGVMAGQSIGEPGTQLTLRTFHIGGAATRITRESRVKANYDGRVIHRDLRLAKRKDAAMVNLSRTGKLILRHKNGETSFNVPYGAVVRAMPGSSVEKRETLFEWDPYSFVFLAEQEGRVRFKNLIENVTYRLEYDARMEGKEPVVVEHRKLHPEIDIIKDRKQVGNYIIPTGAYIFVNEGQAVKCGDMLAKMPREIAKTRDITGGLPRVIQLFEARKPKNVAIVTEIDGVIEFKKPEKGYRIIVVKGEHEQKKYKIAYGKHILVYDGQKVTAGDKLSGGDVDPHDVLAIKGVQAAQDYLVNQIQEVYRLQGVKIDDKHVSIIVRQMLSKVKVDDPADTLFIEEAIVDKMKAREENEKIMALGGEPATVHPVLLGVTRTVLTTDSFISAASFQETTRVLTEAAISGKRDNLLGIKENVIMGNLIPAGTGLRKYKSVNVKEAEDANNKSIGEEGEKETI
jgi:DNA-directed RNA polymerase subunit beta'